MESSEPVHEHKECTDVRTPAAPGHVDVQASMPDPHAREVPKGQEKKTLPNGISLKVVSQDGNEVEFRVKKHTSMAKVMDTYCGRMALSKASVRFLYDGNRVNGIDTAETLEMEDGDIIDVVLQQTGG